MIQESISEYFFVTKFFNFEENFSNNFRGTSKLLIQENFWEI
jgi:hypothetical protein